MADLTIGPILNEIGILISEILDDDTEGAFMYAEAGDGWAEVSVFKDEGERVRYVDPSDELSEAVMQLWDVEEADKKFAVLTYVIAGEKFDADFLYLEDIDPDESGFERSKHALQDRYGDKPIYYPPRDESRFVDFADS